MHLPEYPTSADLEGIVLKWLWLRRCVLLCWLCLKVYCNMILMYIVCLYRAKCILQCFVTVLIWYIESGHGVTNPRELIYNVSINCYLLYQYYEYGSSYLLYWYIYYTDRLFYSMPINTLTTIYKPDWLKSVKWNYITSNVFNSFD
jgi:hypothetical protein